MNKLIKFAVLLLVGGLTLFFVMWAGWWFLRWEIAVAAFSAAHDYLRDSLGLSQAVAMSSGVIVAIISMIALSVFIKSPRRLLIGCGLVAIVAAIPLALLNDELSEGRCFEREIPTCDLWETPEGHHVIRRKSGPQPPSSWQLLRDADVADVRAYLPSKSGPAVVDSADRVPRQISLESCHPAPSFFDASGQAVVYWSRNADGIELWDRRGPHPTTGQKLQPMTAEIAAEVCVKLADAKKIREAQLEEQQHQAQMEQERITLAAQQEREQAQAAQQAAQQAQQKEAQLEQQRKEESLRAASVAMAERTNSEGVSVTNASTSSSSLILNNNDCWAADFYLDHKRFATVPPRTTAQEMSISSGNHMLQACQSGTGICGPEVQVSTNPYAPLTFGVNMQPNCSAPSAGYTVPAPNIIGMIGYRGISFPIRMRRR